MCVYGGDWQLESRERVVRHMPWEHKFGHHSSQRKSPAVFGMSLMQLEEHWGGVRRPGLVLNLPLPPEWPGTHFWILLSQWNEKKGEGYHVAFPSWPCSIKPKDGHKSLWFNSKLRRKKAAGLWNQTSLGSNVVWDTDKPNDPEPKVA